MNDEQLMLFMQENSRRTLDVGVQGSLRCLAKVFIPAEPFCIVSQYNHKPKYILLEFDETDQHTVVQL